jgi:nucleotide-binding universal stress UspA family protein
VEAEVVMIAMRTVLCPVDFSAATERQVDLARDLCRVFGARLVLHHNVSALAPGAGVGWMWATDHQAPPEATVESKLGALLERAARDVPTEARITHGPSSESVIALADSVGADLVLLSTHGASSDDHTSITELVLERARRAVLALHDADADARLPHFTTTGPPQRAVVPTDFADESRAALDLAFQLSRQLPLELHLLHVLPHASRPSSSGAAAADDAMRRLGALVPPDLATSAVSHVATGDPARTIVGTAEGLSASWIVMGEHTRRAPGRWLSRDTSRGVLHRAPCPVWYVPGRRAA